MNCCESTGTHDCEQGRRCPERAGHPIPIELQQLPRCRMARRRTLRAGLLTTLIITLAAAGAVSLVVNLAHVMGARS